MTQSEEQHILSPAEVTVILTPQHGAAAHDGRSTGNSAGVADELRLADRFTAIAGRHYVPGMQARVRLLLDVARRDRAAGLRTYDQTGAAQTWTPALSALLVHDVADPAPSGVTVFGDYVRTNPGALGAAYQSGLLPIGAAAMEEAIAGYAARYLDQVTAVRAREQATEARSSELTTAVTINLHKLLAYRDEYEFGRLHLQAAFRNQVAEPFTDARRPTFHLAPPALRRFGYDRKVAAPGYAAIPVANIPHAGHRLRGTNADPFARPHSRVEGRELEGWYRGLLTGLAALRPLARATALALARLPTLIRGHADVKAGSATVARARAEQPLGGRRRTRLSMLPIAANSS